MEQKQSKRDRARERRRKQRDTALEESKQWRSQDIADARAQHGHTTLICTIFWDFYSLPGRF